MKEIWSLNVKNFEIMDFSVQGVLGRVCHPKYHKYSKYFGAMWDGKFISSSIR